MLACLLVHTLAIEAALYLGAMCNVDSRVVIQDCYCVRN
jgi:hypothetical protein